MLRAATKRFADDAYRRFVQMYSDVVMGMENMSLITCWNRRKRRRCPPDMPPQDWKELVALFKKTIQQELGKSFPEDPRNSYGGLLALSSEHG